MSISKRDLQKKKNRPTKRSKRDLQLRDDFLSERCHLIVFEYLPPQLINLLLQQLHL
jgi:hypothetical protein